MLDAKTKMVASNIRKIREFRNYTQEYLAAKLGISQNAYSKVELGYSNITLKRLVQISDVLEISLTDLINMNGDESLNIKTLKNEIREVG